MSENAGKIRAVQEQYVPRDEQPQRLPGHSQGVQLRAGELEAQRRERLGGLY
jgi:hypothetical protein